MVLGSAKQRELVLIKHRKAKDSTANWRETQEYFCHIRIPAQSVGTTPARVLDDRENECLWLLEAVVKLFHKARSSKKQGEAIFGVHYLRRKGQNGSRSAPKKFSGLAFLIISRPLTCTVKPS
jgi:hypothetical protein